MEKGSSRLLRAIEKKERVAIFADYDVDGTTAVALLTSYLKETGGIVSTYIPDRISEGYGISLKAIDTASNNNQGLIVALDCGIKANAQGYLM